MNIDNFIFLTLLSADRRVFCAWSAGKPGYVLGLRCCSDCEHTAPKQRIFKLWFGIEFTPNRTKNELPYKPSGDYEQMVVGGMETKSLS
jgi:hypothetical protein